MKTINLLPEWYFRQHQQKKKLRMHIACMVVLAGGCVGATFVGRSRVGAMEEHCTDLGARVTQAGDVNAKLAAQQAELMRLDNLELAYRELGNTIPMSAVIQQIQNEMTAGMALSRVTIDVRSEPVKGSGFVGDSKHPPRNHDVAHMVVVGIAPNDVQIAELIGKISTNALFSDVSLNFTHTEILSEHSIRRFEIQMEMELERLATEEQDDSTLRASAAKGGGNAG